MNPATNARALPARGAAGTRHRLRARATGRKGEGVHLELADVGHHRGRGAEELGCLGYHVGVPSRLCSREHEPEVSCPPKSLAHRRRRGYQG
jgi:hypothetical protein